MDTSSENSANGLDDLTKSEEERATHADEAYCKACDESGMKVSNWQDFEAWQEFVDGKIGETQLVEKAKTEVEQFSKTFGKYVVIEKEENKAAEEETEKRKRAKQANKIYRRVCQELQMTVCFFHDFIGWSDYVDGKISETEFYERVKAEVRKMASSNN